MTPENIMRSAIEKACYSDPEDVIRRLKSLITSAEHNSNTSTYRLKYRNYEVEVKFSSHTPEDPESEPQVG